MPQSDDSFFLPTHAIWGAMTCLQDDICIIPVLQYQRPHWLRELLSAPSTTVTSRFDRKGTPIKVCRSEKH